MTTENDRIDDIDAGTDDSRPVSGDDPDTNFDTTMAAGTPSGAAGVANAELGTSGSPASELLSPEELAQLEVTGGAGFVPGKVNDEELEEYFNDPETLNRE